MSAVLNRIEDPRDNLSKASRFELCQIAERLGIEEVHYSAALTLEEMVAVLRSKNVHDIKLPDRPLGIYKPVVLNAEEPSEVKKPEPPKAEKPVSGMSIIELRSACKVRGIKMARTDTAETLRAKLVQNPS